MTYPDDPLLTPNEVGSYLGSSITTIWRLRKHDLNFPKPLKWGRRISWRKSEIDKWLATTRAA